MALYTGRGWHVELICVTNGVGRDVEVERAGKILGIQHIQFLSQPGKLVESVSRKNSGLCENRNFDGPLRS